MKNTMKKLMSLVLVAILLVSAVPFAASASTPTAITVEVYQAVNGSDQRSGGTWNEADDTDGRASVGQVLSAFSISADDVEGIWFINPDNSEYKKTASDSFPLNGGTMKIRLKAITIDTKVKCSKCGVEYATGTSHTCATVTCAKCNETYTQGTTHDCKAITIIIKADTSENTIAGPIYKVPADLTNGAQVKNLLNYCWNSSWDNVYTFDHAWSKTNNKTTSDSSAKIYAGDEVHIMLKTKTTTSTGSSSSSGSTTTNKFPYNVYLNIYKGTTVGTPAKTINITSGIALDGKVTLAEVKSLVLNYYTANTSAGITFDGLYLAKGNWVSNYVYDQKYDEFDDINTLRQIDTVYINVMIDNCTAKTTSTSTADSSNPKTGDSIFMPVAVLGISASALATAFFFANKKRLAK